ncbi:U6 snRNA phosphodiesterase 1-like [Paramacrobiotus metropolitanus]|uniref:U6 snRNA phosphodiesterase 1-like n=1 Tax=Paramacrobiotus metropolitanus TaxID=2943436 RepID=UPI002445D9EC|nr:U6 snRNA phosphodiesterase 1-like [Paramacrobiotus metropolitanus]XP_055327243.1 U6 snRNA phosphodiesterase 1-like [Paramacrobiotus metropolitanus]
MPMVARVRNALRKLIDDYGSSGSDEEKSEKSKSHAGSRKASVSSKRGSKDRIFFRPTQTVSKQSSVSDDNSQSSGSNVDEDECQKTGDEPPSSGSNLNGLLGSEHPTDETPSLDVAADAASDEAEVDGQRTRAFPHFAGNWATFVYIIPRVEGLTPLFTQLLAEVLKIPDIKHLNWSMVDEPHISLSRTVVLRYHEIPQFTAHLKAEIKKSSIPRFTYSFEDVEIYCNDQANTSFLALRVGRGSEEMSGLVKISDTCLKSFNMPQYYQKPEFHLSFAWCPEQLDEADKHKLLHTVRKRLQHLESQFADEFDQCAKAVHCRSGNRSYLMPL